MTYPIQPGKVQPPALRDETLARTRLLDWLDVKIHRRVLFLIADAGYGKTTLLADFSRRTRLRTIWYRLDEDDRDWVGFLAHLVAAGQEHDPEFGPRTAAILRSLEPGGPTREDAIETFLEELPSIATDGAALILDDFHMADEVADIRSIAREIVIRGPERLSIVFASRRPPAIPVSKLRSLGELAELGIADLRFSDIEMEQLFRDTYGRPLEPDVLAELAKRTEGWAASLTLVQAALRERTPAETRSFVRSLSGARDELHDYLAEEVVGDLPDVQQQFLMRTSILQRVTAELAQVASGLDAVEVQSMIAESERLGLLGRRAKRRSAEQRYHPLVREFLEDRLRREVGPSGVEALHVAVATWAEPSDWQVSAYHWSAAGRSADLLRVIENSLEAIVASGAIALAADLYKAGNASTPSAGSEVIASRQAAQVGDVERVLAHASSAAELDPENDVVIANLIASHVLGGNLPEALRIADGLNQTAKSPLMRKVAQAVQILVHTSTGGDLNEATRIFTEFAEDSRENARSHFEGVSELNAAIVRIPTGEFDEAVAGAQRAIEILSSTSSGSELKSAEFAKATALAYKGDLATARTLFVNAASTATQAAWAESLAEHADVEMQLGSSDLSTRLLTDVDVNRFPSVAPLATVIKAGLAMRNLDPATAKTLLLQIDVSVPVTYPAHSSRVYAHLAVAKAMLGDGDTSVFARTASSRAGRQRAAIWKSVADLVAAARDGSLSAAILGLPRHLHCALSLATEVVLRELHQLDGEARSIVVEEALVRPDRWLPAIRGLIERSARPDRSRLAAFLSEVGTQADIALLRSLAKEKGATPSERRLGRDLARRLAPRAVINDLGRVTISVGKREVVGQEMRRKVLALLCLLLTKPRFSATREEVMDAMWPEMDPSAAINSLNQSVYFLRRVFEPEYVEETSAGYVRQESDLLWLDTDLVVSASGQCARYVADHERSPSSDIALRLSHAYREKFALDFTYDEWAVDFRDWLHVSSLRVLEGQIRAFLDAGEYDQGIAMARRAILTDPRNEDLEVSLLRLLRNAGAHAAAAEQYTRYAGILRRDLGVDPPAANEL